MIEQHHRDFGAFVVDVTEEATSTEALIRRNSYQESESDVLAFFQVAVVGDTIVPRLSIEETSQTITVDEATDFWAAITYALGHVFRRFFDDDEEVDNG